MSKNAKIDAVRKDKDEAIKFVKAWQVATSLNDATLAGYGDGKELSSLAAWMRRYGVALKKMPFSRGPRAKLDFSAVNASLNATSKPAAKTAPKK